MKAKTHRTATTLVVVAMVVLLLMLVGLDIYPLLAGNDAYIIEQQAWLQVARDEFVAKDVLILAYRPASYHSQAISDLQVVLPQLEQTQTGLTKGDSALGLPVPTDDIARQLARAQDDYLAITTALHAILKTPDAPVDPTQVNIIMAHEYSYSLAMAQVALLEQQQAEATMLHLIVIKVTLKTLLLLVISTHFLSVGRAVLNKQVELEEEA